MTLVEKMQRHETEDIYNGRYHSLLISYISNDYLQIWKNRIQKEPEAPNTCPFNVLMCKISKTKINKCFVKFPSNTEMIKLNQQQRYAKYKINIFAISNMHKTHMLNKYK